MEERVDVKIGIADSGRELTVSVTDSPEEIEQRVTQALQAQTTLTLVDDKGRRVIVPVAQLAYVEIGPADSRRVGFSVGS
jgi:hypothetical protein